MKENLKNLIDLHQRLLKKKEVLDKKLDRSRALIENSLTKIYKGKMVKIEFFLADSVEGQIEQIGVDATDYDYVSILIKNKNGKLHIGTRLFVIKSIEILEK